MTSYYKLSIQEELGKRQDYSQNQLNSQFLVLNCLLQGLEFYNVPRQNLSIKLIVRGVSKNRPEQRTNNFERHKVKSGNTPPLISVLTLCASLA